MQRKPILSVIVSLFILLNANAQKSSIILRGGLNLANVSVTESGRIDDAKMLTSFQVGFIGDVSLCKFASFQPGLLVTGKGSKTQSGEPTDATHGITYINGYTRDVSGIGLRPRASTAFDARPTARAWNAMFSAENDKRR